MTEDPSRSDAPAPAVTPGELVVRAVAEYERPLMAYAFSLVRNVETARDVVQDTFLRLHQQEPAEIAESLKPWLYTVCRNRAFDVLRKDQRKVDLDPEILEETQGDDPDPAAAAERREAHAQVLALLDRLPKNQREVIRLRFQGDLSYREISAVSGLSMGNVGFLMHTGLKRLRELLQQDS